VAREQNHGASFVSKSRELMNFASETGVVESSGHLTRRTVVRFHPPVPIIVRI
jgi:hypothetical protein